MCRIGVIIICVVLRTGYHALPGVVAGALALIGYNRLCMFASLMCSIGTLFTLALSLLLTALQEQFGVFTKGPPGAHELFILAGIAILLGMILVVSTLVRRGHLVVGAVFAVGVGIAALVLGRLCSDKLGSLHVPQFTVPCHLLTP